jgi:hypothetical protein
MGKSIVYCGQCGRSLSEDEFKRGRAQVIDHQPYCADCRPVRAPVESVAERPSSGMNPAVGKMMRRPGSRAGTSPSPRLLLPIGAGCAAILVIVIVVMSSGAPPAPPYSPAVTPPPAPSLPAPRTPTAGTSPLEAAPRPSPSPSRSPAEVDREMKAEMAKEESAKFDRFLTQIRETIARGWLTPQQRAETGDMIATAMKRAGDRRAEVEKIKAEFDRKAVLVAHWRFEEDSGLIAQDGSGNGHDGEVSSGTARVPGRIGGALSFDGEKDGVTVRSVEGMSPQAETGEMTLALWVRVARMPEETGQKRRPIAAKGDLRAWEYALCLNSNGKFEFVVWTLEGITHGAASGGAATPNQWHHLAGVFERGKSIRLHVDGREAARSTAFTGTAEPSGSSFYIGRRGDGQFFAGSVDDVRLYRRALGDDEIKGLFEAGKAGQDR